MEYYGVMCVSEPHDEERWREQINMRLDKHRSLGGIHHYKKAAFSVELFSAFSAFPPLFSAIFLQLPAIASPPSLGFPSSGSFSRW